MIVDGFKVHAEEVCTAPCPFHAPSDHPMKDAPMHLRSDKMFLVERICEHGVGHDDPDSVAYLQAHGEKWAGVHGCDGCCAPNPCPTCKGIGVETDANDILLTCPTCNGSGKAPAQENKCLGCGAGKATEICVCPPTQEEPTQEAVNAIYNLEIDAARMVPFVPLTIPATPPVQGKSTNVDKIVEVLRGIAEGPDTPPSQSESELALKKHLLKLVLQEPGAAVDALVALIAEREGVAEERGADSLALHLNKQRHFHGGIENALDEYLATLTKEAA